jgi:hypothetical protein
MTKSQLRRGRWAFWLTVAAFMWSVVLLGAAFLFPAYGSYSAFSLRARATGSQTLVQVNGLGALIPVGVALVIAALVCAALHHKCSRGGRVSDVVAWTAISALCCFCLLAIASIGFYVTPVVLLLAYAALLTPSSSPPAQRLA